MSNSSHLTLAQRALLICGALTVLMASAGAITAWRVSGTIEQEAKSAQHLQRYTKMSHEVQQLNHSVSQLASAFKNVMLRGAVDTDRQKYLKEFEDHRKAIQAGFSTLQVDMGAEQDRELLESVKNWAASFPAVADQYAKVLSQYTGADPAQSTELDKLVRGIDRPLTEAGARIETRVQSLYQQLAQDSQVEAASRLKSLLYMMGSAFAASLVLASVLLMAYARWVKKLLGAEPDVLVNWTREIAEGKLSGPRGEFTGASEHSLYANFARMRTALAQLVDGIRQRSGAFDAAVSEIRYQLEASKEAAATQADAGSKMASGMEQMSASVGHVAEAAAQSAQAAELSSKSSEDGLLVVRATAKNIQDTASGALALSERISRLGEQSANISTIIQVIEGIAQQTNLLALNAAIEAARAGEQGRGFAVVADEVRQLAERTTKSTTEIENMVSKIQQDTSEVVDEVQQWKDRSSSSLDQVKRAEELMLNIQNQAMTVTSMVSEVKQALQEQSTVSCELSGQVEKMAGRTEENSNCLEEGKRHASTALPSALNL